uniref:Uncharacterized protein n=1 Tax=Arundo donax TaxID=35708 RepID=A0A0A9LXQ4_ARUDO
MGVQVTIQKAQRQISVLIVKVRAIMPSVPCGEIKGILKRQIQRKVELLKM